MYRKLPVSLITTFPIFKVFHIMNHIIIVLGELEGLCLIQFPFILTNTNVDILDLAVLVLQST